MSDDAFDQLDQRKSSGGGDYAEWWSPSEGDEIIGIVVEKHAYTDPGGNDHPVGTLRSVGKGDHAKGEEVATPTHSALEDDVEDAQVGDVMLIEYEGKVKANTGRDMNAYATSILTQDEWKQTDQAELFQEVWEASAHFSGTETRTVESEDNDDDGVPDKAIDFAEDVVTMNDGEVTIDEMDNYLNEVRDYDLEPAVVVASSDTLTSDGDTIQQKD